MNRIVLFAALLVAGLVAGCKKGGEETVIAPPPEALFSYKVDGIKDTAMERIGEVNMQLHVRLVSGKSEIVKLNATDLPLGMKARFSPQSGYAPFTSVMTLTSDKIPEGNYKIFLTDSARGKGISAHPMFVRIKPYLNDAVAFNGEFKETHNCTTSGASEFAVYISPVDKFVNRINIKGFWTKSWSTSVYADLNPENKTVNVPLQTAYGVTYQGIGTYNDNEISINYTVTDSSTLVNESCTATFKK